jgi:hypothetical protein
MKLNLKRVNYGFGECLELSVLNNPNNVFYKVEGEEPNELLKVYLKEESLKKLIKTLDKKPKNRLNKNRKKKGLK